MTNTEQLEKKLSLLLVAKYGKSRNMGPKTLSIVARVAVLQGWVTEESLPGFDVSPRSLWEDINQCITASTLDS